MNLKTIFIILISLLLCGITFFSPIKNDDNSLYKSYLTKIELQSEVFCIRGNINGLIDYDKDLFNKTSNHFSSKISNNLLGVESLENELGENIDKQLDDIDFDILDNQIGNLDLSEKDFVGKKSFLEVVKGFISGENDSIYNNFIPYELCLILY